MKNIIFIIFMVAILPFVTGQSNQAIDVVKVKVVCKGNSESAAITEGLRSALMQTAGVFISSNTTVINDQMTSDQMTMINNGSIAEYKIIEKYESDAQYTLTLDVSVSVNNLGSFVKNSGGETELQGGLFSTNIKLNELNENAETQSIQDLLEISNTLVKKSFNYSITNGEPTNSNGNWSVPLEVNIVKNGNWENFVRFFYGTLIQIGMVETEIDKYIKLNLPLYVIGLFDNRNLTYSTPTILFKRQGDKLDYLKELQKKQYQFEYFQLKLEFPIRNLTDLRSDERIGFLSSDVKDAIAAESKFLRSQDVFGIHSDLQPYLLTVNRTGKFNKIVFRKEESFLMLMRFITSLHQKIRNVEISNGISKFSLKLNEKSYFPEILDYKYIDLREASCFPISFVTPDPKNAFFTGSKMDLYIHPIGSQIKDLTVDLTKWHKYQLWSVNPHILTNRFWEVKMIEQRKVYAGFEFGLFTDKLSDNSAGLNGEEGRNYSKSYFDLVFGNFALYHADIQNLRDRYTAGNGYVQIMHFPLQLSMIGDDKNVVFKFTVKNILSTTEISKVSKYSIDQL